jgi:hypothetical protein
VKQETRVADWPVGLGASPDGKTLYVLTQGGTVAAYDTAGKELWKTPALLEGTQLAVSPKGDRLAVAGYPGVLVLETAGGKILDGHKLPAFPNTGNNNLGASVAWNDAGTFVAAGFTAGWAGAKPEHLEKPVILGADGKLAKKVEGVAGSVMGVAFVPKTDTVLFGGDKLTAVNAADGKISWQNDIKGAQAFAFSADGKTAAAGGWGRNAGIFATADGKTSRVAAFDSVVGGVALLPDGALAVAVWGGVHPLYVLKAEKPEALFQSKFGFQSVAWSEGLKQLVAAEQGGNVWLLGADGKPAGLLDTGAGTTAYRLLLSGSEILVGRMNRVIQRLGAGR